MRIGLSLSRCMLDIIEDVVDYNDVLVLITRTDFDPREDAHWTSIWNGYTGASYGTTEGWRDHKDKEEEFRALAVKLYEEGKIHQPRQFGAHPPRITWHWLETLAPTEDVEKNPALKKAWSNYKILAGLS